MMHVNQYDGLTIAVSEAEYITRIARRNRAERQRDERSRPVLEEVLRWDLSKIRRYFATQGLMLREWAKHALTSLPLRSRRKFHLLTRLRLFRRPSLRTD